MYGKPLVIARTGDVERAPENTLPAFESAISRGADGVELDVHLSRDGEVVVHHLYHLGATDDGEGLVSEHTLADLKALDSGGWYLEWIMEHEEGSIFRTLALYNAGRGAVTRRDREEEVTGIDLFVEEVDFAQTRTFIDRVYQHYWIYRTAQYGSD